MRDPREDGPQEPVPAPYWEPSARADSAPPGVAPEKWRALSRAERRAFKRRAARG